MSNKLRSTPARQKRILLVASAGGHWVQLSRLSPAFEDYDAFYATTFAGVEAPSGCRPVATISDASRSRPDKILMLLLQLTRLIIKIRPDVIVTTGAAPGLVAIQIGKLFGARTIWIDSLANSEKLSLSGRLAEKHADLWLTQWPHLTAQHPGLKSYGGVL